MPATQIELDHPQKSFCRILDVRNGEENLWMAHKTRVVRVRTEIKRSKGFPRRAYLVMRSSMLRGSRMKVGRTTRLRSAPGRSWEMMCVRTAAVLEGETTLVAYQGYWATDHCPGRARQPGCLRRRHLLGFHRRTIGYLERSNSAQTATALKYLIRELNGMVRRET